MTAKISVFVTCVEAITYLLLYNLYDCTCKTNFEDKKSFIIKILKSEFINSASSEDENNRTEESETSDDE